MMNLLKYQFRKLFTSAWLYAMLVAVLMQNVLSVVSEAKSGYEFFDWITRFDSLKFITFGLAAVVPLIACNDYASGANKTILSRGYSRTQNFFAKLLICLVVNFVVCLLEIALVLLCGSIFFAKRSSVQAIGEIAYMYFLCVFVMTGYTCVYFGVAEAVGKSVIAIIVNFAGMFLLGAVALGLSEPLKFDLSRYLLDIMMGNIHYLPLKAKYVTDVWICIPCYSAAALGAGYLFAIKREAK